MGYPAETLDHFFTFACLRARTFAPAAAEIDRISGRRIKGKTSGLAWLLANGPS